MSISRPPADGVQPRVYSVRIAPRTRFGRFLAAVFAVLLALAAYLAFTVAFVVGATLIALVTLVALVVGVLRAGVRGRGGRRRGESSPSAGKGEGFATVRRRRLTGAPSDATCRPPRPGPNAG